MKLRISRIVWLSESIARSTRCAGLLRLGVHDQRHVLEREGDPVDGLDDPVVEVPRDPLALLDDGQLLDLLVEPGVLDRNARAEGEHLDEHLVHLAELGGVALVREVEVPDRPALGHHGDAEERGHRRVVGREPVGIRVVGDVRDAVRLALADDQAEQPVPARRRPDLGTLLDRHPDRDEPLDPTVGVDDAQGRVLRADQVADALDDELEDGFDVEHLGDRARRLDEGLELEDAERRSALHGLRCHGRQSTSPKAMRQLAPRLGAGRHFRPVASFASLHQ